MRAAVALKMRFVRLSSLMARSASTTASFWLSPRVIDVADHLLALDRTDC